MKQHKSVGTKYGSSSFTVPGEGVSIRSYSPEHLMELIAGVMDEGDCIMFSKTKEGGAVHLRILADGLVEKWYAGSEDELIAALDGIRTAVGGPR